MANDIRMQDPRLRDPINNISDGLKDPTQDKTPGFFQSLRNPYHLMLEESLPASLYQWITGDTKKKQAQEALRFIQNNPDLKDTKLYKTAVYLITTAQLLVFWLYLNYQTIPA